MEFIFGLSAFVALLVLWVLLPQRLVSHRRANATRGAETLESAPMIPKTVPTPRRATPWGSRAPSAGGLSLVGIRITRDASSERNAAPAYNLVIDFSGMNGMSEAQVPIYRELNRTSHILLKERYWTEIAGLRIETGNLPALEAMVWEAMRWLGDGRRLAHYWFYADGIAPVPVYIRDGSYVGRPRGGPQFAASSLALVRERLCAYFSCASLEFMALSFRDLRYHKPHSVLEGPGVWIPVLKDDGRLRVPDGETGGGSLDDLGGLLRLRHSLAEALTAAGRLPSQEFLAITCPTDEAWTELIARGTSADHVLSVPDPTGRSRVLLEILRLGDELACTPDGGLRQVAQGGPRKILFGRDVWVLVDVVGLDLEQRGLVRRDEIKVHQRALEQVGRVR